MGTVSHTRGYTLLLVILFGGIFVTIISGLAGRVLVEQNAEIVRMHKAQARGIAEAGLEYYKWFLAHNPDDITHGTGESGPYEIPYEDPESDVSGTFSLDITGNEQCGALTSIGIRSTGWTDADPTVRATVTGTYAQPSVAEYAYIVNDNVWAGADREIQGRYHANGGVRMDGTSNSPVTSAVEEWTCTASFGCSPSQTQPGVFGSGGDQDLWEYPVPQFDFDGISQDFGALKTLAQNEGLYFASGGGELIDGRGYRFIFNNDRTVDVYWVRGSSARESMHIGGSDWETDYYIPNSSITYLGEYDIPEDCGLIFVEDRAWVSGTVSGKITLIAASVSTPGYEPSIILENDIDYTTSDGSDGLAAIAQGDVHISPVSPDDLSLRGIFVAQEGNFGRNLYPCFYAPYDKRDALDVHGSIISNDRVGTKWTGYNYSIQIWIFTITLCSNEWSGYDERVNTYDRRLATDPPPFTPVASPDYEFIEWREE